MATCERGHPLGGCMLWYAISASPTAFGYAFPRLSLSLARSPLSLKLPLPGGGLPDPPSSLPPAHATPFLLTSIWFYAVFALLLCAISLRVATWQTFPPPAPTPTPTPTQPLPPPLATDYIGASSLGNTASAADHVRCQSNVMRFHGIYFFSI